MRYLFIHQQIPGQFPHLARKLAEDPSNEVMFLTRFKGAPIQGVKVARYGIDKNRVTRTHRYLQNLQNGVIHGEAVAHALLELDKNRGFRPDLIYGHAGWGETLFAKDVFPDVPLINYCEFFYHTLGSDSFVELDEVPELEDYMKMRTKNAVNYIALDVCDRAITPTNWQLRQYPKQYHPKFSVIHEGVDTNLLKPDPSATFALSDGRVLNAGEEIVTYINRSMEPQRGLFTFIDGTVRVAKERPNCRFVIVGRETGRYYSAPPPPGETFTQMARAKIGDLAERFHFVGLLPYQRYLNLLQVSAAHVYLTKPFVLSWSMLEAMSAGCAVIGSATPPVAEVIEDERNGLLFDYFSAEEMAERICEVLDNKSLAQSLRREARRTVEETYSLERCLPQQLELIRSMLEARAEFYLRTTTKHSQVSAAS